jgi:serine/threonine protein phosphatase PrpC
MISVCVENGLDTNKLTKLERALAGNPDLGEDEDIKKLLNNMNETMALFSGTTMTCALVVNDAIWTVNIGDSRTIVASPKKVYQLTEDAIPADERFLRGIQHRGGTIATDGITRDPIGVKKGDSRLAPGRSIGDRDFTGITPLATISRFPIPKEGVNLVLGCDGVFDMLSSDDVGRLVNNSNFTTPVEKATAIVQSALVAGSSDNISALVVAIPGKKERRHK